MEKEMSAINQLLYRFSSRGIYWPAIFGSVFGNCVLPFSTFVSSLIGAFIGYLLILPGIGIISPITFTGILIAAAVVGCNSSDPFWGKVALVLLAIHIIRTITMIVLVRKYPAQTLALDSKYQRR